MAVNTKPRRAAMRRWAMVWIGMAMLVAAAGCAKPPQPDAYGNVEATDVVVGAETGGRLIALAVEEGQQLLADAAVGSVDPSDLSLERDQLSAERVATVSRVTEVLRRVDVIRAQESAAMSQREAAKAQRDALAAQQEIAQRHYDRTRRLFDQQAATAQQLDQAERDLRVLQNQVKAQDEQIAAQQHQVAAFKEEIDATLAQRKTANDQVGSIDARVARVAERIRKSDIRNPVTGTVLARYAKAGEFVQPGQPLYKIADLSELDVRAYVQQPQLAAIAIGGRADVTFDSGEGRRTVGGTISWIASQAEFAPTPIQTREERADLVYAIKVRVANGDGALKIGMPVDVEFGAGQAARPGEPGK